MKLTVTTIDPEGQQTDQMLDLPEGATIGELGTVLDAGQLYLGAEPLGADLPVTASGVREGAVLGLGVPPPDRTLTRAWTPPPPGPALVEVRHVSGPGAGRVWRLGPGSHEIGTDRGCALRLESGGPPQRGTWITVTANGTVRYRLPGDADPARCGLRSLTPPPPVDPETGTPLTAEEPAGPVDGGPGGHSPEPAPPGPDGLPVRPPLPPVDYVPPPDDGSAEWPAWADLSLGDHLLRLARPYEPDAAVAVTPDGLSIDYNRPPRIAPHLDDEPIKMQGAPGNRGKRPFPFMMMMAPMALGLVMMGLFRSMYFIVFVFFTPMMAVGNWIAGRRSGREQLRRYLRIYRMRRAALELDVRRATVEERRLRNTTFPDPAAVLLTATGPGHQLWERRRRDPDHLTIRLGTATRPSLKRIDDNAREANHRQVYWRLADVPYGVEMTEFGIVGLTGAGDTPRAVARWAVAQAAVLHSPRDLRIVVLTSGEHADSWSWVRWLPHLRPVRPGAVVALGNDPESTAHRVTELVASIKERTAAASSALSRTLQHEPDILVVLDGARRLRDVPGVVQVLTAGPPVRVFSLCLDERERLLPEECTAVVTTTGNRLSVRAPRVPAVGDIRADLVEPDWCEQVARALAPIRDVTVDSDSGLPTAVRLLPLIGQEPPDPAALTRAWERRPAATSFLVGVGYESPVRLDLVRDGPHGLIGGTTGAGKSELLQTMIASLAAANRPDELTFVLVDYKGGSAFRECADLPHTLGMITDLDGHLVERALASLNAELRRREEVLASVEAKDHHEYRAKRARDPALPALPRLLLVIDEFATLVRELPDFVPGLIGLAQRGRSLGLHLILATQRPAGSVNSEIKANTNLRIALRVTDRAESQDIVDAPDAVSISPTTPGRALIRRGTGIPTPFQTAWVGAERAEGAESPHQPKPQTARPLRRVELTWNRLGRPAEFPEAGPAEEAEETVLAEAAGEEEPPTDLRALVEAVRAATESLPDYRPQPRPWLPPLEDWVSLADLPPVPGPRPGALPLVPYALCDVPQLQQRRVATIDYATFGHLYVIGAPRSGRTQVLRTIAGASALILASGDLHIYGIDAAGGGLTALESLPHCGAIVSRHDTERLERLIARFVSELTERQRLMAQHSAASLAELRARLAKASRPAHLLLLIDGWDALSGMLDDYDGGRVYADVTRLLREGAAAGIHLIATSERVLLGGRAAPHNDRRLLLRQSDPSDYHLAGMHRKKVPAHIPPGRGWNAPGGVEAQIALLPAHEKADEKADEKNAGGREDGTREKDGQAPDQAEALRVIGRRATVRDSSLPAARRPFRIVEMPTMIGYEQVADRVPQEYRRPLWALIGVGGDRVEPMGCDFAAGGGAFLVAGPPRSGRSTTLAAMCVSLLIGGTALIVITPRDSQLRKLAAHDLAQVITDPDPSADAVTQALRAVANRPVVVVVDDADLLLNCRADKVLRQVATAGRDRGQGLLLSGQAESMSSLGWVGIARRSRQGVLLGPKSIGEGDLIGARLSSEQVRTPLVAGRGWTAGPAGTAIAVQVPLTVLHG